MRTRRVQLDQKSATNSFFGALAGKKLVRFQEYAALYPEATFIFVGDNGQVPAHLTHVRHVCPDSDVRASSDPSQACCTPS